MFILDKPYISYFLLKTIQENYFPIIETPEAKDILSDQTLLESIPIITCSGKRTCSEIKDRASNDLYSKDLSGVRQPIESLFNWLIERSDIQKASKIRSTKGLLVHAYGRLAVAFINLIFQPLIRIINVNYIF